MKFSILIYCTLLLSLPVFAQSDARPVVGVTKFSSETDTKYTSAITEKVVEMLTQSKRFQVVDRTSDDKIKAELENQKGEQFIDSKHTTQQGVQVGADYLVTGNIRQINVTRMMNPNNTIGGYKASLSFTIKIVETATGLSSEAQSFESKGADKALSPERAVDEAIRTLTDKLEDYFATHFPLNVKIVKILSTKGDAATSVLIGGGKAQGLKEGDKLTVQKIEMLNGKPYPTDLAVIKVTKVVSDDFCECSLPKGGSADILSLFNSKENLNCKLVIE